MKIAIEVAIKKFSQAVLNLTNALATLSNIKD